MTGRTMLSVGVDVGTTTTRVVVSCLRVHEPLRPGAPPRVELDAATTLHAGRVHLTPLVGPDRIDLDRLEALVSAEYAVAGIDPSRIDGGAVVVTGETALRRDAGEVARALSWSSGRFVVAVAGPRLEARIAGQGSGAAALARASYGTVVNLDVGGGSTNRAVFRSGRVLATSAMMIGGRALQLELDTPDAARAGVATDVATDAATGAVSDVDAATEAETVTARVVAVSPGARPLLDAVDLDVEVGDTVTFDQLRRLTELQARLLADELLGVGSALLDELALTPPGPPLEPGTPVLVSGGVGDCLADPTPVTELPAATAFGDVGPLLAEQLRQEPRLRAAGLRPAPHTGGATVAGAATRTVTLSGSTIWVDDRHLPLRDLVVVRPELDGAASVDEVCRAVTTSLHRAGPDHGLPAVAVELADGLGFDGLQAVAGGLAAAARQVLGDDVPLVVLCPQDLGQALGQAVHVRDPSLPLVVVDRVHLDDGDLVDLGARTGRDGAVPVSVKTLVFTR